MATNESAIAGDHVSVILGNSDGSFRTPIDTLLPFEPGGIAAGDVDGDGRIDLLVEDYPQFQLLTGSGDGTFAPPRELENIEGTDPLLADLNNDGHLDLAFDKYLADRLEVRIGDGTGSFAEPVDYARPLDGDAIHQVDLNAEGRLDLIMTDNSDEAISVWLGNGDGTLGDPTQFSVPLPPSSMATADFNGDGSLDAAFAFRFVQEGRVGVLFGNGDGTFPALPADLAFESRPGSTVVGDLNADRIPDIATSVSGTISILEGNGDGTYQVHPEIAAPRPSEMAFGDIDGDANQDIVIKIRSSDTATVLLGNGDFTFDRGPDTTVGFSTDLELADIDGDGLTDLLVAHKRNHTLSVFRSSGDGAFAAPSDVTTVNDIRNVQIADLNGDGLLDLAVRAENLFAAFPGEGQGAFGPSMSEEQFATGNMRTQSMELVDVDADGDLDVLVGWINPGGDFSPTLQGLRILANNGDGTFVEAADSAELPSTNFTVGDLNNDAFPDIAAKSTTRTVGVFLGEGDGTFAESEREYPFGESVNNLRLSDLDLDGDLDLVSEDHTGNAIAIRFNATVQGGTGSGIDFDRPVSGRLSEAGERQEWTFDGSAGQSIAVVAEPATAAFSLGLIDVRIVAPDGAALATGAGTKPGELISLLGVTLPADGTYRVQIRAADSEPNGTGAYRLTVWNVASLEVGSPFAGTFDSRQRMFQVEITDNTIEGRPLTFELSGLSAVGTSEMYVKRDALPSSTRFDGASRRPFAEDHFVYIPRPARTGTYYVLLFAPRLASSRDDFELTVSAPALLAIRSTDFGTGGNAGDYSIHVAGTNLDESVTARLTNDEGFDLPASTHRHESQTDLYATFDLRGVTPGTYDVVFANSAGEEVVVMQSLTVASVPKTDAVMPQVIAPSAIRRDRQFSFTVEWANTSLNDAPAPPLTVWSPVPFGLERGDYSLGTLHTFLGTSSRGGPAGVLRPGQRESVTFYAFSGTEDGAYTVSVDRTFQDSSAAFDWDQVREVVQPDHLTDAEFRPLFDQVIAQIGPTNGDYLEPAVGFRDVNLLLTLEVQFALAELTTSVSGNLVAQEEGLPLAGREILARNLDTGDMFSTTSLHGGWFVLPGLIQGSYSFEVEGGVVENPPLDLAEDQSLTGLELDFVRGASLEGTVTHADTGRAIDGATVHLASLDPDLDLVRSAVTDGSGRYAFAGLPAATYLLSVAGAAVNTSPQRIVVADGDGALTADLVVEQTGTTTVTVLDAASGKPVVNAFVFVLEEGNPDPIRALQTDAAAMVHVDDLPGGTYAVRAVTAGYASESEATVTVTPDETSPVTLNLMPVGGVAGRLVDGAGGPVPHGRVGLVTRDGALVADGIAAADGQFEVGGVGPGDYFLQVFTTTGIPLSATAVTVAQGQVGSIGDVTLPVAGVVEGTVRDGAGAPVADVVVAAFDAAGNEVVATVSNADGAFRLGFLQTGNYRLVAASSDATFAPADVSVTGGTSSVALSAGARTVSGVVLDPDDQSVAGAAVLARLVDPDTGATQIVRTTADFEGRFVFGGMIDGGYRLRADADGLGFASADVVVSGADVTGLTLQAAAERTVGGTVLDPNGEPLAGATVQVYAAGQADGLAILSTGPDGSFTVVGLPPRTFDLTAFAGGMTVGRLNGVDLTAASVDGQTIQLGASGTTVTGTAATVDGKPVDGVVVTAEDAAGRWVGAAVAAADGSFQFDNLPAEAVILAARIDGFTASAVPVDLTAGGTVGGQDVTLVPLAVELTTPAPVASPAGRLTLTPRSTTPGWLGAVLQDIPRSPNEPAFPEPPPAGCDDNLIPLGEATNAKHRIDVAYSAAREWQNNLREVAFANLGLATLQTAKLAGDMAQIYLGAKKATSAFETAIDGVENTNKLIGAVDSLRNVVNEARSDLSGGSSLDEALNGFYDAGKEALSLVKEPALDAIKDAIGIIDLLMQFQMTIDSIIEAVEEISRFHDALLGAIDNYEQLVDELGPTIKDYNSLEHDCEEEPDDEDEIERPNSSDPNDIIGPAGFGPQNHVVATHVMPYTIRFENDPEVATAPAAEVTITQTIDEDLDWTSFRLGDLGFGETIVEVPAGRGFFETRVDVTGTHGVLVDVRASIDATTGEARWQFTSIDPQTGELPADPFVGFLPPNDDAPEGDGFVTYTIDPLPTAETGDRVDAEASIVFDVNEPILTPPVFHTFDTAQPTSRVMDLPSEPPPEFEVSWTGADDQGGSGIRSFDIYVSVDGGPFELWLDDTTDTAAVYPGAADTTYAFYSRATDNVGHTEPAPATEDAIATPVASDLLTGDFNGNGIVAQGDLDLVLLNWGGESLPSGWIEEEPPIGAIDQQELDVVLLNWGESVLRPAPVGDYDGNGLVDQADLDLVLLHWGEDGTSPPTSWTNDLPSGRIDQGELDGVLLHWGETFATADEDAAMLTTRPESRPGAAVGGTNGTAAATSSANDGEPSHRRVADSHKGGRNTAAREVAFDALLSELDHSRPLDGSLLGALANDRQ